MTDKRAIANHCTFQMGFLSCFFFLTIMLTSLCHHSSNTSITHNANPRQESEQIDLQPQLLPQSCKCALNFGRNKQTNQSWNGFHWYVTNLGQSWKRNLEDLKRHLCFPANYISLACTRHKHFILERGSKTYPESTALNTATSNAFLSFK